MLRHIPLIFVLQGMLYRRPEVHRQRADLKFHFQLLRPLYRLHRVVHNQMKAAISAWLALRQIIFDLLDLHITALSDDLKHLINILDKLADHTNPGNILDIALHIIQRNILALAFLDDAGYLFDTPCHLLDRTVHASLITFLSDMIKLYDQLIHRLLIRCDNLSP